MQRRREACTFRTVLADFAVCDWRPYCKTPCDKKCIQLEGNGQQFSHITVCWVLWFNKRSQQKVYNALFSKGSEYIQYILSATQWHRYLYTRDNFDNSLTAELVWHFCQYFTQVWLAWRQAELSWADYCSLAQTFTKSGLAKKAQRLSEEDGWVWLSKQMLQGPQTQFRTGLSLASQRDSYREGKTDHLLSY